ncbi:MAG: TIGR02444 family protein [Marinicaulis sp.]|nr:TIGR02444 family protein [Marinicaulis sp.]
MSGNDARNFTPWSIETYKKPGVETALLELQDKCDFNVNIALWACWCAEYYGAIEELLLRKAIDMTARWNRDVTVSLRRARRAVKAADGDDKLYEDIKSAELAAEFAEQEILIKLIEAALSEASTEDNSRRRAAKNLTTYASLIGAPSRPGFSIHLLETLIEGVYQSDETAGTDSDA